MIWLGLIFEFTIMILKMISVNSLIVIQWLWKLYFFFIQRHEHVGLLGVILSPPRKPILDQKPHGYTSVFM